MGFYCCRFKWCSLSLILYYCLCCGFPSGISTEKVQVCPQNLKPDRCCPVDRDQNKPENSNVTCPENYLKVFMVADCMPENGLVPGNETNTTTSAPGNTTNISENMVANETIVCIDRCPENETYNSTSFSCMKCDSPDKINCSVCKYEFNSKCYAHCPNGTVAHNQTESGTWLCKTVRQPHEDKKELPVAIIAGSVGGGGALLIVIVVVVVVCCCRRRHPPSRRPISVLAENRNSPPDVAPVSEQKGSKSDLTRPRNYENQPGTLRPSVDAIQQQGDQIFRYTKDPTVKEKKEEDKNDRDSLYGNQAMIRLASKTDLTGITSESLQEQLEIEELGDAPMPLPAVPDEPDAGTEDYLPMVSSVKKQPMPLPGKAKGVKSHAKARLDEKASAVPSETSSPSKIADKSVGRPKVAVKPVRPDASVSGQASSIDQTGLEDYENVDIQKGKIAAEDQMEDYENAQLIKKESEQNLEDYENTVQFRKKKNTREGEPALEKSSSKQSLEDYENAEAYKQTTQHEELYENMKFSAN